MKYWLLALSIGLLLPNFFDSHLLWLPDKSIKNEDFDPKLAKRILNLKTLEELIDSTMKIRSQTETVTTEMYADIISSTIRSRFFHSYSHYSLQENWMAAVAGKFVWYDLSAIVIADDILQYPMAACSQQAIVLMEYFKLKGISFRKIAFDHHFAVEGKIDGQWIFFDPNLEPEFHGNHRSFEYLKEGDRIKELYKNKLPPDEIHELLGNPHYGEINLYPAPKARVLHYVLESLSKGLWLFPLFLFFHELFGTSEKPHLIPFRGLRQIKNLSAKRPFIFKKQKSGNDYR